jgi:hypothetical protein
MPEMSVGIVRKELDLMRVRNYRLRIVSWKSCGRFFSFPPAQMANHPRSELHHLLPFSVLNNWLSPDVNQRSSGDTRDGETIRDRHESAKVPKGANK